MATINRIITGEGYLHGYETYVGGAENYTNINSDDAFTTYASYPGGQSSYHDFEFQDFTQGTVINSVTSNIKIAAASAAYTEFTPYCQIATTLYYAAMSFTTNTNWYTLTRAWAVDPSTTIAWTRSGLNAATFGVRFACATTGAYCTYSYITIDYDPIIGPFPTHIRI